MSQRASGYARRDDEEYETIPWPVLALLQHLPAGFGTHVIGAAATS
jgi:hypothetical protein